GRGGEGAVGGGEGGGEGGLEAGLVEGGGGGGRREQERGGVGGEEREEERDDRDADDDEGRGGGTARDVPLHGLAAVQPLNPGGYSHCVSSGRGVYSMPLLIPKTASAWKRKMNGASSLMSFWTSL